MHFEEKAGLVRNLKILNFELWYESGDKFSLKTISKNLKGV